MDHVSSFNMAFAVGALLSITIGTLYQKRFVQPCDVRSANTVQIMAAFAITVPLALAETQPMNWNVELAGALAWSVLGLTVGGSSLFYMLIQRGAAAAVTSLMSMVPPTTAILAWLLFGESITSATLVGTALTALGVSLVVRSSRS
jgi:drug/metabolite transporter (DMT)-like permease